MSENTFVPASAFSAVKKFASASQFPAATSIANSEFIKRNGHHLTFVTVLYSDGGLGGFVVSHVAQTFTFPGELILDDHAILNIAIFLEGKRREETDFF